jgi:hypothetical protein
VAGDLVLRRTEIGHDKGPRVGWGEGRGALKRRCWKSISKA